MKLREKTYEAFVALKEAGGYCTTADLAASLGIASNSLTGRLNSLVKNGLAVREKVLLEDADKPITYVSLTDAGKEFVQPEDDDKE